MLRIRPLALVRSALALAGLAGAALAAFPCPAHGDEVLLYDVTFTGHPLYQPPVTGNAPWPRRTVSHNPIDGAMVMGGAFGMGGRPCVFNGGGQFRLWLFDMPVADQYDVEFDLVIDGDSRDPFQLDLFAPNRRTIHFDAEDGRIHVLLPEEGHTDIGGFTFDETMRVRVTVVPGLRMLALWVDDVLRYVGSSEEWGPLAQVAMGCSYASADELLAAVDDITITGEIDFCDEDLDRDGVIDAADLSILLADWGACAGECRSDVDGDGTVDAADLATLLAAWGGCDA